MTNKKLKLIFVPIEFFLGLTFGLLFAYLQDIIGETGHINSYYFKLFLSIYIGVVIGIGIPGLIYTIKIKKPFNVLRGLLFSTIGLITFLLIYILISTIAFNYIPYALMAWFLPIFLPMTGAVVGFNFKIDK